METIYDWIVIGAGASGLFFAAAGDCGSGLVLEKTDRPGTKLRMSGGGHCNVTHAGSIKDFLPHYHSAGADAGAGTAAGRQIRTCLYKHNNLELMDFLEASGVPTAEQNDGRVFPASMRAADVLEALLARAADNGYAFRYGESVTGIEEMERAGNDFESDEGANESVTVRKRTARWRVRTVRADGTAAEHFARAVVVATGGCSYPSTGSDGSMLAVLARDLGLRVTEVRPSLCPIDIAGFPYADLAGISFPLAQVTAAGASAEGALLLTHTGFSGPAALNLSGSLSPGDVVSVNYIYPTTREDALRALTAARRTSRAGLATILSELFDLPRRFAGAVVASAGLSLKRVAAVLTGDRQTVRSAGSFSGAMVTRGGVALDQVDLRAMELKDRPGVYVIGEVLDVDGDTGGYNLQFAYSSARAAVEALEREV